MEFTACRILSMAMVFMVKPLISLVQAEVFMAKQMQCPVMELKVGLLPQPVLTMVYMAKQLQITAQGFMVILPP